MAKTGGPFEECSLFGKAICRTLRWRRLGGTGGIKNMNYWAHSENKSGKKHPLSEHLLEVGRIASSLSNNDKYKLFFRLAGILHDFGKYQPGFQRYLEGKGGKAPHSVWGAGCARILKLSEISFAIDGHHKGLPNRSGLKTETEPFKRKEIVKYNVVFQEFLKDLNLSESELSAESLSFENETQKELFIRYLFSALVDADWLNTEEHFDQQKLKYRGIRSLDIEYLQQKLNAEFSRKSKEGDINKLRNQVREEALQRSELSCGFYSLNLPTGLGKTLVSISWALQHAKTNKLKHIFVVLPYINIIDQTASVLKEIFGEELVLEHHSAYNEEVESTPSEEYNVDSVEKERRLACENWDYPIVVTTTVQFFESLFSNKPSKCRKIHNIAESVVIFDEVQSLPKEIILPTLTILKNINAIMRTSFLFCTATQPAFEKRPNFNGLENICPLIENPAEIFKKTHRVDYNFLQSLNPIGYDVLLNTAINRVTSVLVIFNTKKPVLDFYNLTLQNQKHWDKCYYLSTALCPSDRKRIIRNIREDLEKKRKILVSSTQLIEAGVDFDFPCVLRAMAPLEAVIQSAGRCNREGTLTKGKVYLFQLKDSGMPDKTYGACAQYAKGLIEDDINKLHYHNLFQQYYAQVVSLFIDPDKNKILQAQENFDFETVNDCYKVIDKITRGLFIYKCSKDSRKLFDSIKNKPFLSRDDHRKMQVFTVQVYQNFLKKNKGLYEEKPQGFILWHGKYSNDTGISDEPLDADDLVV
ncbi:MAG: hypothetical protein DDT32_00550 [Syntrophomonadaceae bacterium]|nr:hypothetical protein [Bacillota bacterium]